MSDNEAEEVSESEAESEVSINEEDLLENNKDYNSEVEDSDDDGETKSAKKKPIVAKIKAKKPVDVDDDDDDVEEVEDEDEIDELEIDQLLIEEAEDIRKKLGIIVDPRDLDDKVRPNPRMKCEIIVDEEDYISSEYLSLYEFCELVSIRAQHISDGAFVFVEIESETTASEIAKKELKRGKCPFLIKRYMTPMNSSVVYVEIWNPNLMAIDDKFFSSRIYTEGF
jgi:DNA-directed RNA polymerase subunit K/omega